MDIPWEDLQLFLAVAEERSVSGAARRLRLGQPTVSRRLADLEYRLGYALFRRSAAGAALTSAGDRLVAPARRMAEWAGEAARAAASRDRAPRGLVRITAPPGIAVDFVAPFAAFLQRKHPQVSLQVLSSIQLLDLARGEADLALRSRPANHADLVTVARLDVQAAPFVTRELAAKLPRKATAADLPWIGWAPPYEALPPNPQLEALGLVPVFTSDSFLVQQAAAEAGVGALALGRVRHRFSRASKLVPLDIDLGPAARGALHLVCAKSALDIPRVRLVADLLAAELDRTERV